jgi:UDP-glucose 4-epimerase
LARYLVTGVAGFIGRSIAAALLKRGETVRGIDNYIAGKPANLIGLEAMEFIEGDLSNPAVCAQACAGVEIVFHEAALASVPRSVADPVTTNVHCVGATLNLLVAARAAGVRRVIYAGSSAAYGDSPTLPKHEEMPDNPISPYAVAKLAGEHYMRVFARVYGLETVVLRYFNVFGPYQDPTSHYSGVLAIFCRRMLAGEQVTIHGDGEQSRDFTYIDNVVEANLLAASAPAEKVAGQMMNVATGTRITLNATVEILRELTGYQGHPRRAPVTFTTRLPTFAGPGSCWDTSRTSILARGCGVPSSGTEAAVRSKKRSSRAEPEIAEKARVVCQGRSKWTQLGRNRACF